MSSHNRNTQFPKALIIAKWKEVWSAALPNVREAIVIANVHLEEEVMSHTQINEGFSFPFKYQSLKVSCNSLMGEAAPSNLS